MRSFGTVVPYMLSNVIFVEQGSGGILSSPIMSSLVRPVVQALDRYLMNLYINVFSES